MKRSVRRVLGPVVILGSVVLGVIIASTIPIARDALALVITVGLVAAFLGIRIIASRLGDPEDGAFESWGGMNETLETIVRRYRRPGGNPIRPDISPSAGGLPEVTPRYRGHPVGRDGRSEPIPRRSTPPET